MTLSGSLIILGLLVLAWFAYHRQRIHSRSLLALRLASCLCLGLIVSGWVLRFKLRVRPNPTWLCLVDLSQSMTQELSQVEAVLDSLQDKLRGSVEYWGFADSLYRLSSLSGISANGTGTDLTRALEFANTRSPGGVILITDGQHNRSSDPAQAAQALRTVIYIVGVGAAGGPDLGLERVLGPSIAYLGDTVRLRVRYSTEGFEEGITSVELGSESGVEERKELRLTSNFTQGETEFELVPKTSGDHRYHLSAPVTGDLNPMNNELEYYLKVLPSRLRVLYLSNSPTFNHRFLVTALKDEPEIELTRVIALQSNRFIELSKLEPYQFPEYLPCDLLILDNFNIQGLDTRIAGLLKDFAMSGGILILAGEEFRAGALSEIIPGRPIRIRPQPIPARLTASGLAAPIFYTDGNPIFSELPPLGGWMECAVKKSAQIWAEGPSQEPLILFSRNRSSRILQINSFPLWQWGFAQVGLKGSLAPFKEFILNLCRYLSLAPEELFKLETDKPSYRAGEEIVLKASAISPELKPLSGLDLYVSVSQTGSSVPLIELAPGYYEGKIDGLAPGRYNLTAELERSGLKLGEASSEVVVLETSLEELSRGQNRSTLSRIATAAQGSYLEPDEFLKLELKPEPVTRTVQFIPRLSPWLYLLFTVLFGLELFLRKSRGLS